LKSTPIANFGFSSKGGWFFVAILSCCNLCQLFFLELFLSSKKPWFFFSEFCLPRSCERFKNNRSLDQKKSLRGQPTTKKKQVGFGPKNRTDLSSIGWNIGKGHRGLANETDLGILVFLLRKTWAGCYEKEPAKKIWPIADNDPWKSKTIRIIVPNLGWSKFLLKQSSLVKTYSFNGLWTSRMMIVIFLLDPKPQKVIRPKKSTHKIPLKLV